MSCCCCCCCCCYREDWLNAYQSLREFHFVPLEGAPGQIIQVFILLFTALNLHVITCWTRSQSPFFHVTSHWMFKVKDCRYTENSRLNKFSNWFPFTFLIFYLEKYWPNHIFNAQVLFYCNIVCDSVCFLVSALAIIFMFRSSSVFTGRRGADCVQQLNASVTLSRSTCGNKRLFVPTSAYLPCHCSVNSH